MQVNELLEETGQVSLSELAVQYGLGTELLATSINARMGSQIKGWPWRGSACLG